MSTDIAQTNLREPDQVDWDAAFSGSSYVPPPQPVSDNGQPIVYYGKVMTAEETTGFGLAFLLPQPRTKGSFLYKGKLPPMKAAGIFPRAL